MKSAQILKQVSPVALAALALGLFAGRGKAQQDVYQGKFTLPFQAEWGGASLPPGHYTITMPSSVAPYLLYLRGEHKSIMIWTSAADSSGTSDRSQLTVVSAGGHRVVTTLKAGQLGLILDYPSIYLKTAHEPAAEVSKLRLTVSPAGS